MSLLAQAAIGIGALLAAYALIELWDAHNRHRRAPTGGDGAEDTGPTGWHKPPAASGLADPRRALPGQTPGAGTIPVHPAPGPKLTITIEFYDDGSSKVLDHTRRRRFVIPGSPVVDLSDDALARFLDDLH